MEYQTATTTIPTIHDKLTLSNAVGDLRKRSATWEHGALASSNSELYSLLAACYAVYKACIVNTKLTTGVDGLLKFHNIMFSKDTSLGLKVVRVVFATAESWKEHQYRHFAYARVLEVAHEKAVSVDGLVEFINNAGGIDEIRRGAVSKQIISSGPTKDQYANVAKAKLSAQSVTAVKLMLDEQLTPRAGLGFSLAIVRSNQDGTGNIVFGLSDAALVERALEIAGEALIKKAQDRFVHEIMLGNETFVEDQMQTATEILQTSMKPKVFLPDAGAKKTTATAK